ncbi:translation initiation factor IF-2 subunit gamma [Candidatus Pacearchaeota archaeon CG10_big_fil_rev_8_21_14_0_10_35_13]|nr:MAG: translation initiation factor IF-2 subunit gamma [Candidatus Pacearchaeota archaeon CG10_big_fil_rev_8_21_14_0_10_35_13]
MTKKEKEKKIIKEENVENIEGLPVLNVGIVGHIDHGKTTLLSRMTGKWTDQHSEELKRGITIKLGYADAIIRVEKGIYSTEKGKALRYVTFVDAPGHEMLMATMLSGAAIMDAAILLVAANEGVKPQTREHLMALQAKNITKVIIVQNKIDLVTKEEAQKNFKEIKEFVKGTIAENSIIIPCSAQQNINVEKILEALTTIEVPERDNDTEPVFVIARSFDINRPGTKIKVMKGGVLGGALKKGILKVGDEIMIKPGMTIKKGNQYSYEPITTKIKSLSRGEHKITTAGPGGSLAIETLLDPSITKADSLSGNVVGIEGKLPEITERLTMKHTLFKEIFNDKEKMLVETIKTGELLMLSVNTTITVGNVQKINPKEETIEMTLKIPVVNFIGEKAGIARNMKGHWRLIGWGEIL